VFPRNDIRNSDIQYSNFNEGEVYASTSSTIPKWRMLKDLCGLKMCSSQRETIKVCMLLDRQRINNFQGDNPSYKPKVRSWRAVES
jgi:hypothetical protein